MAPCLHGILVNVDLHILDVISQFLALFEEIGINLCNFIEPILPILDSFGGEQGEKTIPIPLAKPLPITNKELPDLFFGGDERRLLGLKDPIFYFGR